MKKDFKKEKLILSQVNLFQHLKDLYLLWKVFPKQSKKKKKVIKGPKADSPQAALDGFIKSNNLDEKDIYKKNIEKGEFYFAETKPKVIDVVKELQLIIPEALQGYSWKKSMKWSVYDLSWGRPLKSIIAILNNKVINFAFFHLQSNNLTLIDGMNEDKIKKVSSFKSYLNILESQNIILDQEKRKNIIVKKMNSICNSRKLINNFNEKLIEEVVNLVEKPNVIVGKFDEIYLKDSSRNINCDNAARSKIFSSF